MSPALKNLKEAVSDPERNALALRLAELQEPGLGEVLERLIRKPELRDRRGTLVHALGKLRPEAHIELLVDLVVEGNWEVAHEALDALRRVTDASGTAVERAEARLTDALAAGPHEDWRQPLLSDLQEGFR